MYESNGSIFSKGNKRDSKASKMMEDEITELASAEFRRIFLKNVIYFEKYRKFKSTYTYLRPIVNYE